MFSTWRLTSYYREKKIIWYKFHSIYQPTTFY